MFGALLRPDGTIPRRLLIGVTLAVCLTSLQCSRAPTEPSPNPNSPSPTPPPTGPNPPPTQSGPALFSGAGDIANCDNNAHPQRRPNWFLDDGSGGTARLLENIGGTIFTLGDNVYPDGIRARFLDCYDRTWGRPTLKGRTYPAIGNHDYGEGAPHDGSPFFDYFGANAGPRGLGYHAYNVGAWRVYVLNSNFMFGADVSPGGAQAAFLRADLQANPTRCALAYWHHPLFSSGPNGNTPAMRPLFRILYENGVDVVLTGHDHMYERFARQDPEGALDPNRGIRQFVVGTGGTYPLSRARALQPNSQVVVSDHFGILKLTLNADNYHCEFVTTSAGILDSGDSACNQ
jgi:acid phosphatase type 7